MPTYEYECAGCGRFSARRSLAEYAEPALCPACGLTSPRAVSCPAWLGPSERQRRYDSVQTSPPSRATTPRQHASGCACCRSDALKQAMSANPGASNDVD